MSLFFLYFYITNYGKPHPDPNKDLYLIGGTVFLGVFGLIIYLKQRIGLKFKKLNVRFTNRQFTDALINTVSKMDWVIEINSDNLIQAYRKGSFASGSWGELITIIYLEAENKIFINSICDPGHGNSPSLVSWGWNRKHIEAFITNIEKETETKIPFYTSGNSF